MRNSPLLRCFHIALEEPSYDPALAALKDRQARTVDHIEPREVLEDGDLVLGGIVYVEECFTSCRAVAERRGV
jgi:hypothetical protein